MSAATWDAAMDDLHRAPFTDDCLGETLRIGGVSREGLWLEFGVYKGGSLRRLAEARGDADVYGFDSFDGLPADWRSGYPKGAFELPSDRIPLIPGASIIKGLFADTLPGFLRALHLLDGPRVTFVHVDCDLYSSTKTVLEHCLPYMDHGSVLVFDELHSYEGCEAHEMRALKEAYERGLRFNWICRGEQQASIRKSAGHPHRLHRRDPRSAIERAMRVTR